MIDPSISPFAIHYGFNIIESKRKEEYKKNRLVINGHILVLNDVFEYKTYFKTYRHEVDNKHFIVSYRSYDPANYLGLELLPVLSESINDIVKERFLVSKFARAPPFIFRFS